MRTKVLSVILFLSILIISCDILQQNEYYHLDSSFRSLLKTGDTLVYIDSKSRMDTFFVFSKISGTDRVSLSGSSCQIDPSAYYDLELLYLIKNKEKVIDPYCISLDKNTNFGDCARDYYCDETILIVVSAIDNDKRNAHLSDPRIIWYGNSSFGAKYIDTMNVLDNCYDSVYYCKSINIQKTDSIQEIYYSYKYGIIQMNLANGNELKLVRK